MAWRRSKTGQIIWYINRTYRVLPTVREESGHIACYRQSGKNQMTLGTRNDRLRGRDNGPTEAARQTEQSDRQPESERPMWRPQASRVARFHVICCCGRKRDRAEQALGPLVSLSWRNVTRIVNRPSVQHHAAQGTARAGCAGAPHIAMLAKSCRYGDYTGSIFCGIIAIQRRKDALRA